MFNAVGNILFYALIVKVIKTLFMRKKDVEIEQQSERHRQVVGSTPKRTAGMREKRVMKKERRE
jgi:hypothetical protein